MSLRELELGEPFASAWAGRDPFLEARRQQGESFRVQGSRRTLRFALAGGFWFLKWHGAVSWREVLKNLAVGKLPVVSARNEWRALRALRALGIDTLVPVAYGRRGLLPGQIESFLITEDLGAAVSLEDLCRSWPRQPPAFAFKQALLRRVAWIGRRLHLHGICHRDFYLCHFLMKDGDPARLHLIDLHRALIHRRLASRWVVKDIGSLYFSALDIGLGQRDLFRFMSAYSGKRLRATLREDAWFWRQVEARARRLRARGRYG